MNLPVDTALAPKPTLPATVQQYFEQKLSQLKVTREVAWGRMEMAQENANQHHDIHAEEPSFLERTKSCSNARKESQVQV